MEVKNFFMDNLDGEWTVSVIFPEGDTMSIFTLPVGTIIDRAMVEGVVDHLNAAFIGADGLGRMHLHPHHEEA